MFENQQYRAAVHVRLSPDMRSRLEQFGGKRGISKAIRHALHLGLEQIESQQQPAKSGRVGVQHDRR